MKHQQLPGVRATPLLPAGRFLRALLRRWLRCRSLGAVLVVLLVVLPTPAHAACGTFDLTTCVNAAQYAFWQGIAAALWSINRVLLTLAYQLDVFRAWLVDIVFRSVFEVVAQTVSPALAPVATIAVLVGILLFLLMPVLGRVDIVNIRRALVWIVAAPLLLSVAGQGLASAEQMRTSVGLTMFAAAQQIGSTPQFGAASDEMNADATPLYPFSGCGGGILQRPFADATDTAGLQMDDLAASMMYADAEDIHCPQVGSGPGLDLPDGFYSPVDGGPASGGGDYATTQSVSDMSASESAEWTAKIQRGCTRLLMGIVPSLLAVMNAVIQVLFALALVLLFVALPLGLLLVFFTDSSAGVTGLARRMINVLQTSWSSSLLLGIVFVALMAAASLGNVAAFVGLSLAGVLLTCFVIMIAINAFMSSVQAVAQTVGMSTGISGSVARTALQGVTGGASAVAASAAQTVAATAGMGMSYAVARRAGASRRYALGTAAGQIGGVARVGGLAAALGMQNEVTDGIYTGERGSRSREGLRLTQRLTASDAAKKDSAGLRMREREQERDLQHQVERARRGNAVDAASRWSNTGVRFLRQPVATTRSAVAPHADRVRALSGDLAHRAWERARTAHDAVEQRAGADPSVGERAVAVAGAAAQGFRRDARSGRMRHDGRGRVRYLKRIADAQLPSAARREPTSTARAARLLREGYDLQLNSDNTVTYWKAEPDGLAISGGDANVSDLPGAAQPHVATPAGTVAGSSSDAETQQLGSAPSTTPSAAPGGGSGRPARRRRSAPPQLRRRPKP